MFEIQLLHADHAPALLAFETENRAYFAASIPDRGDAYFAEFSQRHAALLAEQATGACYFHVIAAPDGSIAGRVNLIDVADGTAELGYRIAERAAGQGLATWAVREVSTLAKSYGLKALWAMTDLDNVASQKVLTRAGFECTGDVELDGRPARRFTLILL